MKKLLVLLLLFSCKDRIEHKVEPKESPKRTLSYVKPIVFSQYECTKTGGSTVNDAFRNLNTSAANVSYTATFPTTGNYRFDFSGYVTKGSPVVNLKIDGALKKQFNVSSPSIYMHSFGPIPITSGSHKVMVELANYNSGANAAAVNLFYFTQTDATTPAPLPAPTATALPTWGSAFIQAQHFQIKKLRGFNNPGVSSSSLSAMAATGANIVRKFVTLVKDANGNYTFRSGELTNLETAINLGAQYHFYVMACPYINPSYGHDYWGNNARKESIKNCLVQIAAKYKDNKVFAGVNLLNEPRLNNNYAELIRWYMSTIDAVRAVDPNHPITVEVIVGRMFASMLPLPFDNIIYSPHVYSDLKITHQGVSQLNRIKYPNSSFTKANVQSSNFNNVMIMKTRFNVPMFVGEFSCAGWAPKNDQGGWSAVQWTKDVIDICEANGISWAFHAWREYKAWDPEISAASWNACTYSNAAPTCSTPARSSTAPMITMLKQYFALNK